MDKSRFFTGFVAATLFRIPVVSGVKGPVVQEPVVGVRRTPFLPAPWWVGVVLVATLVVGALAAVFSPVTQFFGGGLRRRWRRGVRPTER